MFPNEESFISEDRGTDRALGERPVQSSPVWTAMAPKRKRSASEQPGWPKAAEAAAAAARAAAVAAGQPSYTFTWSEGGSQKTKEMWIVDAPAPREYPRVVKQNAAARDSLRPSKLAATAKVRHVRDHLVADGIEGDWDEPEER